MGCKNMYKKWCKELTVERKRMGHSRRAQRRPY